MPTPSVTDLACAVRVAQMRGQFVKLVEAQQAGHTGDIVPRGINFAGAMTPDFPDAGKETGESYRQK